MEIKKASDGWHTDGNAQIVMVRVEEGLQLSVQRLSRHGGDKNCSLGWQVMMLSDPRGLIGGDTEIRCGDGSIRSVKWPGPGFAMMMQVHPHWLILHIALKSACLPAEDAPLSKQQTGFRADACALLQGMIVNHNVQPIMTANGEIQGERLTMVGPSRHSVILFFAAFCASSFGNLDQWCGP